MGLGAKFISRWHNCYALCFNVSIHAPAWGATHKMVSFNLFWHSFNPRSRVGSDNNAKLQTNKRRSFNPRSRVGSDGLVKPLVIGLAVSIHAPAWGATTPTPAAGWHQDCVSIHAPAWGATSLLVLSNRCIRVSIHAPAWGATPWPSALLVATFSFNPRSRVGSDPLLITF